MLRSLLIAALAAGALAPLAAPASATGFCDIRSTRDGFVALRAGPSPDARLLARMRPGDEVMLGHERSGPWQQVTYWSGRTRLAEGFARGRAGWVHSRLISQECG